MKSRYFFSCLFAVIFWGCATLTAQVNNGLSRCGNSLFANPNNNANQGVFASWLQEFKDYRQQRSMTYDTTMFVQVVVHVVYNTPEENLPDSVILNQIEVLNQDYGRSNPDTVNMRPDFQGVKSKNSKIVFYLANTDPQGNPTTGITRTNTSRTTFFDLLTLGLAEGVKSTADGGIDPWDQNRYLNIWVCDMAIPFLGPAVLGYATPPDGLPNWDPGSTNGISDGVVIQYQCFGANNPNPLTTGGTTFVVKGRTAVHEVGHYLGLRHIWGDENNCTGNDGMDDTPVADDASQTDCDPTKNTCTDNILGQDLPDMIENYMDYSSEDCQNSFTQMQVDFMRWVLSTKRPGIFYPSLNGVNNLTVNNKLSFQPNPVNSIVRFSFDAPIPNNSRIELFDLAGKCVRISEPVSARLNYEMDLSDLDKGIYMVRCTAPNGVVLSSATKLVKN